MLTKCRFWALFILALLPACLFADFPPLPTGTNISENLTPADSATLQNSISLAVNDADQAIAVWLTPLSNCSCTLTGAYATAESFSDTWSLPALIPLTGLGLPTNEVIHIEVDLDESGNAWAILTVGDGVQNQVAVMQYSFLTGSWGALTVLSSDVDPIFNVSIAQSSSAGFAAAAWVSASDQAMAVIFDGAAWGNAITAGPGGEVSFVDIDINDNQTAVLVFTQNFTSLASRVFNGSTWTSADQSLSPFGANVVTSAIAGLDNFDNGLIIWEAQMNQSSIYANAVAGGVVSGTPTLLSSPLQDGSVPALDVSPNGRFIAAWQETLPAAGFAIVGLAGTIMGSVSNIVLSPKMDQYICEMQASINDIGNAVAAWCLDMNTIQAVTSQAGAAFTAPQTLSALNDISDQQVTGVSLAGPVVAWFDHDPANPAVLVSRFGGLPPGPPVAALSFTGKAYSNKFLDRSQRVHRLVWVPTNDMSITGYNIYKNGQLLDIIPASGPYFLLDVLPYKQLDEYQLTAFNIYGGESPPLTVVLY